jgi:nucleotide-binding universal stress UspA family protein
MAYSETMKRAHRDVRFQSILCPVDFSEQSRVALRYAEILVTRSKGQLTVLYVNDPLLVGAAAIVHDRAFDARAGAELRRFVGAAISARARSAVSIKAVVSVGTPADEIAKAARRLRADVIVMGTHGLTGPGRLLVGSTTQGVLHRATVPVLAIPSWGKRKAPVARRSWPGKLVLAAVELDRRAEREARAAADIARLWGSAVRLVHVVPDVSVPAWLKADVAGLARIRVSNAQASLEAIAARLRPAVKVTVQVLSGDPADEIAAVAAAERVSLVITTLRATHGWLGPGRGSISYRLLSHATTPVLALPGQ